MNDEKEKTMREEDLIIEGEKEDVTIQEPAKKEAVREENPVKSNLKVAPGEQDAVAPKAPKKEEKEESPVKMAYTVGVREDGQFVFEVTGSKPSLLELLGLQTFAGKKIELMYGRSQVEGEVGIMTRLQMLDHKFNKTLETLNHLFNSLAVQKKETEVPVKPTPGSDNLTGK
jgi:hypothetical protein